jgi:vacuolar-type H+-ATPase subunit I/STV1
MLVDTPLVSILSLFSYLVSILSLFACLVSILEYKPSLIFPLVLVFFILNVIGCLLFGLSSVQWEGYCSY